MSAEALLVVGLAIGWLLVVEAWDRIIIRPAQERERRAEIMRFWTEAFDRWERDREQVRRREAAIDERMREREERTQRIQRSRTS